MKRTLLITIVAAALGSAGIAAYAHGDHGDHGSQGCKASEGKPCPAASQGEHRHGGNDGAMQKRMQDKHAGMEQRHAAMADMHARMHGQAPGADKPDAAGKDGEHKH